MQETARDEHLWRRVVFALADGEEYPEEIYIDVNFALEDDRATNVVIYREYSKRYRLTEVLEALCLLVERGLVTFRPVAGYDECCGWCARLFRLTDAGEEYWEKEVRPKAEEMFG